MSENVSTSEALVQRIISDAELRAEKIVSDAKSFFGSAVSRAEEEAAALKQNAAVSCAAQCEVIKRARATLSAIETKKTFLTAKQAIVEKVFSRALEKLVAISAAEYLALIDKLVKNHAEKGDVVVLSESAPVTALEVKALPSVEKLSLKVEKTGKFEGGIVLSGKVFDKDLSFKALCEAEKEKIEAEIAKKLFG